MMMWFVFDITRLSVSVCCTSSQYHMQWKILDLSQVTEKCNLITWQALQSYYSISLFLHDDIRFGINVLDLLSSSESTHFHVLVH